MDWLWTLVCLLDTQELPLFTLVHGWPWRMGTLVHSPTRWQVSSSGCPTWLSGRRLGWPLSLLHRVAFSTLLCHTPWGTVHWPHPSILSGHSSFSPEWVSSAVTDDRINPGFFLSGSSQGFAQDHCHITQFFLLPSIPRGLFQAQETPAHLCLPLCQPVSMSWWGHCVGCRP